ncbi:hypothetical protein EDC04DRAFT_788401 [Pisolithus marmoratus]|nr:hypothetical protein EDC04DRAFT_788401 [Pisolithus marmoratus]
MASGRGVDSLTHVKHNVLGLLSRRRITSLLGSVLVATSAGTSYVFGVRAVDSGSPRIPLGIDSVCFLVGYAGMKHMYDEGTDSGTSISSAHFALLVICGLLTGLDASAGLASAVNSTAKSFSESARATTATFVFFWVGAVDIFKFDCCKHFRVTRSTSAFLLLLALATSISTLFALFVVRPIYLPPTALSLKDGENEDRNGDSLLGSRPGYDSYSASEVRRSWSGLKPDSSPDIHEKMLLSTLDFYFVCTIISLLSGTGIMCSISLVFFAESNSNYDEAEASEWQAAQVSTLSIVDALCRSHNLRFDT